MQMVSGNNKVRVIDTSTAFRVNPSWAYGFAEMDKEQADKIKVGALRRQSGLLPDRCDRPSFGRCALPASFPMAIRSRSMRSPAIPAAASR